MKVWPKYSRSLRLSTAKKISFRPDAWSHIADFEAAYYQPGQATPSEILQELMAARGLEQKDLMEVFGSRSRISEAVNGKRPFSKAQAKALSTYFNVSAELFL